MSILLETRGLTRILPVEPPVTLVQDANLAVKRGRFVTVIGPSGCGKSSLLYLLGLLDRPTEGALIFDGVDASGLSAEERARLRLEKIGFVFQFHFLLPEFTARENVMIPIRRLGRLTDRHGRERAMEVLESVGLSDQAEKTPDKMSGGQRQRVAIARALANDPVLLLGDEPTGNLDSVNSERVVNLFRTFAHDQGRAVICVTHDQSISAAADRRIHMLDGRIVSGD
ncbi:ABC transporter ATP-binding protein [Sphingomonas sp. HDW15A]|uniref:ABC transporter ATP-binding protein n=1 Tax=Sphingomonas sp. HDW15A TaxID=2714942 RepID=UPI0014091DE1|nr:ABC transporter ATP-binding protein [Sphingomonas sp. HDW15A]QIK96571.1 ABC transporter ATP-binding protein [Sphingomonas sp. HDW15A]